MTTPPDADPLFDEAAEEEAYRKFLNSGAGLIRCSLRRSTDDVEFTPEQLAWATEFFEGGGLEKALKDQLRQMAASNALKTRDPAFDDAAGQRLTLSPMPEAELDPFVRLFRQKLAREELTAMQEQLASGPSYVETALLLRIVDEQLAGRDS